MGKIVETRNGTMISKSEENCWVIDIMLSHAQSNCVFFNNLEIFQKCKPLLTRIDFSYSYEQRDSFADQMCWLVQMHIEFLPPKRITKSYICT